jgi:hypothetical protein
LGKLVLDARCQTIQDAAEFVGSVFYFSRYKGFKIVEFSRDEQLRLQFQQRAASAIQKLYEFFARVAPFALGYIAGH